MGSGVSLKCGFKCGLVPDLHFRGQGAVARVEGLLLDGSTPCLPKRPYAVGVSPSRALRYLPASVLLYGRES